MPRALLARRVLAERRGDAWLLRSPEPLGPHPERLGDLLRGAAARAPDRDALLERGRDGALRRLSWAEVLRCAEGVAAALVDRLPPGAPVLCLSGNSVDHALLAFGSFLAGTPFVPVSPAYSTVSADFSKLRHVAGKVRPGLVYADAADWRGLDVAREAGGGPPALDRVGLREAFAAAPGPAARAREAAVRPDDLAKILFTSGSTGLPKGVLTTHRMCCANQQMIAQCWPFLADGPPPVLVDWLPWSHTFGGSHDLHLVLRHAGTLLVDEGRPTPAGFEASIANYREVPPTLSFNVPAGYASLVPRLEADPALRDRFFSRLDVAFYAGAALPPDLWRRLRALADAAGRDVFLTTAWGSTETSPLATSAHFPLEAAGNVGLPVPGVTLKLVPSGDKLEVRVAGPNVTAGYLGEPALTAAAFDADGFYRIGDAMRFADPSDPAAGLVFDGRVAEDFKLASGTWVSVTEVRTGFLAAAGGALADVVVAGEGRDRVGLLGWPSPAGCRALVGADLGLGALCAHPRVLARVAEAVAAWNAAHPGSASRVVGVRLLDTPADLDAGEITDKGYTNQRAVLARRRADVDALFAPQPEPEG